MPLFGDLSCESGSVHLRLVDFKNFKLKVSMQCKIWKKKQMRMLIEAIEYEVLFSVKLNSYIDPYSNNAICDFQLDILF